VYMAAMGQHGLREAATQSHHKTHYLAEKLNGINGFEPAFQAPFFHEFAVRCPQPVSQINAQLKEKGIIGGFDLGREYPELENVMLLCCTEKRTREEMDAFATALGVGQLKTRKDGGSAADDVRTVREARTP
jgi:glycine dehydrogenase subunit 1